MHPSPVFQKTRFAPTPSGYLHLGNVLSFALTAMLAGKTGAGIFLRIDDLDQDRVRTSYLQDIFDTLDFLGFEWNAGPKNVREFKREYSQVHRLEQYNKALEQLRENAQVFACACTRKGISLKRGDGGYPGTCRNNRLSFQDKDACWRLITPAEIQLEMRTLNNTAKFRFPGRDLRDFIVKKKNGFPSYQLASLIDDLHFGTDLVVRGLDLLPSSLAQLHLAACLGQRKFRDTAFYHHPLIMGPTGKKLSKSAGDTSIRYLRRQGKKPADIYTRLSNMLGIAKAPGSWQELTGLMEPDKILEA